VNLEAFELVLLRRPQHAPCYPEDVPHRTRRTPAGPFAALITSSSAAVTPAVPAWLAAAAAVRSTKALRASAATTASSSRSTPPPAYRAPGRSVLYLPGFRGRIDRMLGRSPGECRKGQHAPTWRKAADDQLAAYTDVPAGQKHQAVEPVAVCTSGSLTSGSKDDAEAPKATGRVGAVSRAGQG
jgi:hypothetical protein